MRTKNLFPPHRIHGRYDNDRDETTNEQRFDAITRGPDTRSSSLVASVEKCHVKGRKCHRAEPKLQPEVGGHVAGATRDIVYGIIKRSLCLSSWKRNSSLSL